MFPRNGLLIFLGALARYRSLLAVISPEECCVVIPCLNEERQIRSVVTGAQRFISAVFVVDDGSSDATAEVANSAGAIVIRHESPHGKGEALRSGLRAAFEAGFKWGLAMDGDGQHEPSDIPAFLRMDPGIRLIIGNRMGNEQNMPWLRRRVNRWMSRTLGSFCGEPAPDSQCGFRMIHLPTWSSLRFVAKHFEIESELFVRFAMAGFRVGWVPVQTRYGDERSKIHPARDTLRWFRWWIATRRELGGIRKPIATDVVERDCERSVGFGPRLWQRWARAK